MLAVLGFARIAVVVVKCGRNSMVTVVRGAMDVTEKYVVVVVLRGPAGDAVKQIAGIVDLWSTYILDMLKNVKCVI